MKAPSVVYDKENLIPMILTWHLEQGDAMIRNTGQWQQFFPPKAGQPEHTFELREKGGIWAKPSGVSSNLLPFLVAMSTGKDDGYLKNVIREHGITHEQLNAFTPSSDRKILLGGCSIPLSRDAVYVKYCSLISHFPDLKHQYDLAKAEPWGYTLKPAMTFSNDPEAWPLHALEGTQIDGSKYMLYLRLSGEFDYSNSENWPEGKFENLMVRSGAYTERFLLNCNYDKLRSDAGDSYWYHLLCEEPRFYETEAKTKYYQSILNSEHAKDPRFLQGLRAMAPREDYDLLKSLSDMMDAVGENNVIENVLLSRSMLSRAVVANNVSLRESQSRGLNTKLIRALKQDPTLWLASVCEELTAIHPQQFSRSDLTAIDTVLRVRGLPQQDLSSVDIPGVTMHILDAFEAQKENYAAVMPFREQLVSVIKHFAQSQAYTDEFLSELPDTALETFAMAGLEVERSRLSLTSRAAVISFELGC